LEHTQERRKKGLGGEAVQAFVKSGTDVERGWDKEQK
jgi:hypothetical protein